MKKARFGLLISMFVLIACLFAISVAADEQATDTVGHNLALEENVQIVYIVDETVPAGAESGVLFWLAPQESYTYANATYRVTESYGTIVNPKNGHTCQKYAFTELSAKMMTVDVYAVSYVKEGENFTYGNLDKYSVLQYAQSKKGSTKTLDGSETTLGEVIEAVLEYGAVTQKYFSYRTDRLANATYYQITVVDGTLPDGTTKGLYQAGEAITLTAPASKDDLPFSRWENSAGETVSATVTVPTKNETYTAVYEAEEVYDVKFALNNQTAAPGETVALTLSVASKETAEIDGLLAYNLQYDSNVLEFLGFTSYGTLITNSVAGVNSVVTANNIINLGYSPAIVANGKICELQFRIKEGVANGTETTVSMQVSASKNRKPLDTVIAPICVIIAN